MHWACWIAASALGVCAGYMLHSARVRMLTARERAEMEVIRDRLRAAADTVEAVHALIRSREGLLPRPSIVPRPPR